MSKSLCPKELVLKPNGSVDRASKWVKNGFVIVKPDV